MQGLDAICNSAVGSGTDSPLATRGLEPNVPAILLRWAYTSASDARFSETSSGDYGESALQTLKP